MSLIVISNLMVGKTSILLLNQIIFILTYSIYYCNLHSTPSSHSHFSPRLHVIIINNHHQI